MALSQPPSDWHCVTTFPDADPGATSSFTWSRELADPIDLDGQDFVIDGPLVFQGHFLRESQSVNLDMTLSGQVWVKCARCLKEVRVAIQEAFRYSYILRTDDPGKSQEPDEEIFGSDVVLLMVSRLNGPVDLSDQVWECLLCSLPLYARCDEDSCALPLPSTDGVDYDLRFQALADFLKGQKEGMDNGNSQE